MTDAELYRHRFPKTIIQHALWLYHRFPLSFLARAAPKRTRGRYRDVMLLARKCSKNVGIKLFSTSFLCVHTLVRKCKAVLDSFLANRNISMNP